MADFNITVDSAIPVGNTLFVDAVNGNNTTALPDRLDLPYLTLAAARTAAASGDLVWAWPGSYTVTTNLSKNGVNWHLCEGVTITIATDQNVDMFGDGGTAMTFNVGGAGILKTDPTDTFNVSHVVSVSDPASVVSVTCLDIINVGTQGAIVFSDPIHQDGGSLTVQCRDIISQGIANAYPVWWSDGHLSVHARNIRQLSTGLAGTVLSFTSVDAPTGEAFVKCDVLQCTNSGSNVIDQFVASGTPTLGSTAKSWVDVLEIIAPSSGAALAINKYNGGNLYVTAQKISGKWNDEGAFGELYVTAQKVQTFATDDPTAGVIILGGLKSFVNIGNLVDGDNNDTLIVVNGGTQSIKITNFTRVNNGSAIDVQSGTLLLSDSRISTAVDATASVIVCSGGAVEVNNCELIAEATAESISSAAPQTINSVASRIYQAVGADITVTGDMFYDDGTETTGSVATLNADGTWSWAAGGGGGGIADGDTLTIGLTFPNAGLKVLDTAANNTLAIGSAENLSANRSLNFHLNDADRILSIGANTTLNGGTHSGTNTGDNASDPVGSAAAAQAAAIAAAATDATTKANAAQAFAIQRANHTGTQLASTISDFNAAALAAAPAETVTTIGSLINGATSKTTPVDADMVGLMDSAASNVLKKLSWANVKATLKTYFDTLYQTIITFGTGVQTALGVNVGSAGSFVVNGGALGTPSSGTATNLTGTATGLTAGALSTEVITRITSDFSTSSTTLVDVTGGTAAMLANKDYIVEVDILFQSTQTTTGLWLALNGPASPTSVSYQYQIPVSAVAFNARIAAAYDAGSASTDVAVANTTYYVKLFGIVRNGANAGNIQLRLAAENANAVSVRTGTRIKLTQTN